MDNRLFGNRIPLFARDGFIICFEAQKEDQTAEEYFKSKCGWSEKDCEGLNDLAFFCACVSAWKDGKQQGIAYLGACCYNAIEEFYTAYKDDYFSDMVDEAIDQAKQTEDSRASKAKKN